MYLNSQIFIYCMRANIFPSTSELFITSTIRSKFNIPLGRNHMCVRSQGALSVTRTPVLSGNMLRRFMDQRPMSQRNNATMLLFDSSHPKATARTRPIPSTVQEVPMARLRPTALLEEQMTASKSNPSRLRPLW